MAAPNYYCYGYLVIITCVVLSAAQVRAGDDDKAAGSLLGGKKLIIGVPKKPATGFVQFVDLELNSSNKNQVVKATGFSIDAFEAVIAYRKSLHDNISFEFRAFVDEHGNSAGNYDALVYQIFEGKYDAVVGDVAIVANRSKYVDFTLRYRPADMRMLVKVRHDPRLNMWIFVQPFTWDLWFSIAISSIFIGGIIVFLERPVDEDSPCRKQLCSSAILWLPVMQAVLPERKSVAKAGSRFVLVLWLMLAFVLMQSYTARLSSILTIDSSRLKKYSGIEEYEEALDKGSRKGGVDAIFNEISYLKINMVILIMPWSKPGTAMRDMAFPKGSNLTSYFSRAILNVRESEEMDRIEQEYFGSNDIHKEGKEDISNNASANNANPSLSAYSFAESSKAKETHIPVGVVVDLNSSIGRMAIRCMKMAHDDFYKRYSHYQTRLDLRTRDSQNDVVQAASADNIFLSVAALKSFHLMTNENVDAITGPLFSEQARFVIQLGHKYELPLLKWHEIIPIYEDTEYGKGLIPYLTDALEKVNTRVPYRRAIDPNSDEYELLKELKELNQSGKRIFLVHMTNLLGPKFFSAVNKAGMMTEGYGWIVTDGLSNVLDPLGLKVVDSMQGVLGVRPRMEKSRGLTIFRNRWKASSIKSGSASSPLTLFGLWAYDTVWGIAMAAESKFANPKGNDTLIDRILDTKFEGLSGNFKLNQGQLKPLGLEVFNVVGRKERVIGYWSPQRGLFQDNHLSSREKLMPPIWPGDARNQPTKLRIGVPVRKGFNEFLKVETRSNSTPPDVSGFTIDVFKEVIIALPFPFPYEFLAFQKKKGESTESYDELVLQIEKKVYDAVVGDITIVANRADHVDFTLPYSESGVLMVVSMKHDERQNMWIFLKPLSPGLWLTTGAAFVLTGIIIWLHERRTNTEFQGSPQQQLGVMFWFSFSTIVFAHKERLVNNWSRFLLILWVFVVLIITQSYTASLASMLTVQRLQPKFMDVNEIRKNNYCVGYMKGSFVKMLLKNQLGFKDETKLKPYETPEEYDRALASGEVAAIFDEIPYLKLFLSKYGSKYASVGPTYKTGGFGFAFPLKSPLVSYFSRAILNVTQDEEKFQRIRGKYFSSGVTSEDEYGSSIPNNPVSLTVSSFGGLFIITGVASGISLLFYLFKFGYSRSEERLLWLLQLKARIVKCLKRKNSSLAMNRTDSRVHPATSNTVEGDTAIITAYPRC
ncbi:glutamate receptor 2.9-like [Neltuma alba]|uniref:glutamate receptor 2.9-like n=1 Tax=Neltuma alba TaxID=207710 RepID=UPI0010A59A0B|nr:glutamate receptor 2.9-like [Prosopis alba]